MRQTSFMANEIPYIQQISADAVRRNLHKLQEVKSAISSDGYWEAHVEWRISTVTSFRIEPEFSNKAWWFKVSVQCGGEEMTCHSTTLERALEFMGVYDRLTMDLMWTLGWSDWAGKGRLD